MFQIVFPAFKYLDGKPVLAGWLPATCYAEPVGVSVARQVKIDLPPIKVLREAMDVADEYGAYVIDTYGRVQHRPPGAGML